MKSVRDILGVVQTHLAPDYRLLAGSLQDAPTERGAYALVLPVENPVTLLWRKQSIQLAAGWFVYAGNANAAGGIRGRLRHHMRANKLPHWHIDHLTNAARDIDAFVGIAGSECDIITRLSVVAGFQEPLPGFGSSDCRRCRTHLLQFTPSES